MGATAQNTDQIVLCAATIYYGTAGEEPTLTMGYTDDEGLTFAPEAEIMDIKAAQRLGTVKRLVTDKSGTFSGNLLQATLDNLAQVIPGATLSSTTLTQDPTSSTLQEISCKLVGVNPDGIVRTYKALYANPVGNGEVTLNASGLLVQPFELKTISKGAAVWTIVDGSGSEAVTLSTGAFARAASQTYYKMSGEGAAADALSDVTGATSLVNNELLILQIASASQPITVTHATGVIELDGEANWIMADVDDVLFLRYNLAGTKWVEVGRYSARSDV